MSENVDVRDFSESTLKSKQVDAWIGSIDRTL